MDATDTLRSLPRLLVADMVERDLVEFEIYGDIDFSMRKGMQYLRQLGLALAAHNSLDEALAQWLPSVRYQTVWRYVYQWLSWQPAEEDLSQQEQLVETLKKDLSSGDGPSAIAALQRFQDDARWFAVPPGAQAEVESGLGGAIDIVAQRWEPISTFSIVVSDRLHNVPIQQLAQTFERAYLVSPWLVLNELIKRNGRDFSMPQPPAQPAEAEFFARRLMETLDAAGQMPPARRLYGAAHEFEKYPRLLSKLLSSAGDNPSEAIDLWFSKLLREMQFTTVERMYIALDEFRRYTNTIESEQGSEKLIKLIRHVANAAIVYAFQYAVERDAATVFRRQLGEHLDLTDEPGTIRRLLDALANFYAHRDDDGIAMALGSVVGPAHTEIHATLIETARGLLPREARDDSSRVNNRAHQLLEQTLRLAIFQPRSLRPPAPTDAAAPNSAERASA